MYLADTNDYESPNDAALYQARRIVDLMRITNANVRIVALDKELTAGVRVLSLPAYLFSCEWHLFSCMNT